MSVKSRKIRNSGSIKQEAEENEHDAKNYTKIPWPEWSDSDLNAEKWDSPKNSEDGFFEDLENVILPKSLKASRWIRARELDIFEEAPTVFVPSMELSDLVTNNKHILHSEFIRSFISTVMNLQYCGRNGLEISGPNNNFSWNKTQPWQGWFYVYSLNKVGNNVLHKPIVNDNGKYIIRLFFMARWRRITIDDKVPVDNENLPLLPRTTNNELWPLLLVKGLLKIASLTFSGNKEIMDFHPVACLTGWTCLSLNVSHLSASDKWDVLIKYTEHFKWPDDNKRQSENSRQNIQQAKDGKVKEFTLLEKPGSINLFVSLADARDVLPETIPGISPCWGHLIYIELCRSIPLDPKDVKPPLARWKYHRWLDWAIKQKIINPEEYLLPIRCLKIVSPLRKSNDSVSCSYKDSSSYEEYFEEQEVFRSISEKALQSLTKINENSVSSIQDVCFWVDFHKMTNYIEEIKLFYKSEYFEYHSEISDIFVILPKEVQSRPETTVGSARSGKSGVNVKSGSKKGLLKPALNLPENGKFIDQRTWALKLNFSRNEPLYFFTDSMDYKYLLVNFQTFSLEKSNNEIPYLLMEKHHLFRKHFENLCLLEIKTYGTNSRIVEIPPGRHLLKIFIRSRFGYVLTISSDIIFYVGNYMEILNYMKSESKTVEFFIRKISNSMDSFIRSFGSSEFPEEMRNFYRSCLPDEKRLEFGENKKIHEILLDQLVKVMEKHFSGKEYLEILFCLRVLFINPTIGRKRSLKTDVLNYEADLNLSKTNFPNEFKVEESEEENMAATKIQSFFKMILIKIYKKMHQSSHKQHKKIVKNLHKIIELFNYTKHESAASILLRNLVKNEENIAEFYSFSNDLNFVIQVQEVKGVLSNSYLFNNQWFPIVRFMFNVNEATVAKINLFASLEKYSVRVFNNNSGREIFRTGSDVIPFCYNFTENGYSLFGYGWNTGHRFKDVEWTVCIVTRKGDNLIYLMETQEAIDLNIKIPSLMMQELENFYIPNKENYIAKWIIRVSKPTLLSFRFQVSSQKVKILLKVITEQGLILKKIESESTLILPLVYLTAEERFKTSSVVLEPNTSSNSLEDSDNLTTHYYLEANVLNDTWPLTRSEWDVVRNHKSNVTENVRKNYISCSTNQIYKSSKTDIKQKRRSQDRQLLEKPFWILQIVSDYGNDVEVWQDDRQEKEIRAIKQNWNLTPDRLKRGCELRQEFLEDNYISDDTETNEMAFDFSSHPIYDNLWDLEKETTPRTLNDPKDPINFLPKFNLQFYMMEEGLEYGNQEYLEDSRNQTLSDTDDFKQSHSLFLTDESEMLNTEKTKYFYHFKTFNFNYAERKQEIEKVYAARRSFVKESTKSTIGLSSSRTTTTTIKKKKKVR